MVQREIVAKDDNVTIITTDNIRKKDFNSKETSDSGGDKERKRKQISPSTSLPQDWRDLVRISSENHMMKKGTLDYFCKNFDSVPCVEFCLSMATVLKS